MKGKQSSNQNTQKLIAAFYQKNYSLIEIYIYIYYQVQKQKSKTPNGIFFYVHRFKGDFKSE